MNNIVPEIKLYNSLTKNLDTFKPIDENSVRMYVCGPTVYDLIHIGNARPLVVFDILFRLLKLKYSNVVYVRNITDVDDKINERANQRGISIFELTSETIEKYSNDCNNLNLLLPSYQPKATDYIKPMIDMISTLIDKGYAYITPNEVMFDISKWKKYGEFADKNLDELIAGARVDVNTDKINSGDFALWKKTNNDEHSWSSPWFDGKPGWHIECSAMAKSLLGDTFDIHGGGIDLKFPHHQNEIAQSCVANDTQNMANYWLHNGYLTIDNEKMSKSLGNFYTVKELLEKYDGEVIRYALITAHYVQPLEFSDNLLETSKTNLDKIYQVLENLIDYDIKPSYPDELAEALCNNINTSLALSVLNKWRKELSTSPTKELFAKFLGGLELLGIGQRDSENWLKKDNISPEVIELANMRVEAKRNKDFKKSDELRDKINSLGYEILDSKYEFILKRK